MKDLQPEHGMKTKQNEGLTQSHKIESSIPSRSYEKAKGGGVPQAVLLTPLLFRGITKRRGMFGHGKPSRIKDLQPEQHVKTKQNE